jgi:hypothetical protein
MNMINKLYQIFHRGYPKITTFSGSPEENRSWISEALSEIDRHDWKIPDDLWKKLYTPEELCQLTINFPKGCVLEKWYWLSPEMCMEKSGYRYSFFIEGEPNTGVLWPNSRGRGIWAPTTEYALKVMFISSLSEIPLYINDSSPVVRHIAKWRLEIAK